MMKVLPCLFMWMSYLVGNSLEDPSSSLRLVSILYRHGDRSPAQIYPKDINQVDSWPDGLGWLSNIGKRQQYELGQYVKRRYHGFLNTSRYDHNEIAIESSALSRCLMSAYSHLAGLFTPQGDQVWKSDLEWQPIPVQTRPVDEDNKLAMGKNCPRYHQLYKELLETEEYKQEEERNKEFYRMVEDNTGIERESLAHLMGVADTLICEKAHNMTWNDWVNKPGVWEKMDSLKTWSFDLFFNNSAMARLKGGPLLKEIINNMINASKADKPLPKFYMYSAHDSTLAAFLNALHVWDRHQPIYRALVMVELHRTPSDYIVRVFYRNDTNAEPSLLIPKGCSEPCSLQKLVEVTRDTVPGDWDRECQEKNDFPGVATETSTNIIYNVVTRLYEMYSTMWDNRRK